MLAKWYVDLSWNSATEHITARHWEPQHRPRVDHPHCRWWVKESSSDIRRQTFCLADVCREGQAWLCCNLQARRRRWWVMFMVVLMIVNNAPDDTVCLMLHTWFVCHVTFHVLWCMWHYCIVIFVCTVCFSMMYLDIPLQHATAFLHKPRVISWCVMHGLFLWCLQDFTAFCALQGPHAVRIALNISLLPLRRLHQSYHLFHLRPRSWLPWPYLCQSGCVCVLWSWPL